MNHRNKNHSEQLLQDFYIVEKIVKRKYVNNQYRYLVKWDGYSSADNTWEPIENLITVASMVEDFNAAENCKKEAKVKPSSAIPSKQSKRVLESSRGIADQRDQRVKKIAKQKPKKTLKQVPLPLQPLQQIQKKSKMPKSPHKKYKKKEAKKENHHLEKKTSRQLKDELSYKDPSISPQSLEVPRTPREDIHTSKSLTDQELYLSRIRKVVSVINHNPNGNTYYEVQFEADGDKQYLPSIVSEKELKLFAQSKLIEYYAMIDRYMESINLQ